jgi:hypothetical protein
MPRRRVDPIERRVRRAIRDGHAGKYGVRATRLGSLSHYEQAWRGQGKHRAADHLSRQIHGLRTRKALPRRGVATVTI